MNVEKFIGKTLGEMAEQTSMLWKPAHIFVLQSEEDDTGTHLMDAYAIRQVITAHPHMKEATIVFANDYYGETVIRARA